MAKLPIIEINNLTNAFGEQVVHDGLNLRVEQNEIIGIVGGSGSGKSVLLRAVLGLRPPQAGEISVNGTEITSLNREDMLAVQRQWGVLFQSGALFSSMSVLDNIMLPMREHTGLSEEMMHRLAAVKLKLVGLPANAGSKRPSELSGGMIKRAALARALALDPSILFLDEPTAGLDPIGAADFDKLVKTLQQALQLTVFIITHDLDTLVSICDRIAVLVDKKMIVGTLDEHMENQHPWIHEYFHGPRMRAAMKE